MTNKQYSRFLQIVSVNSNKDSKVDIDYCNYFNNSDIFLLKTFKNKLYYGLLKVFNYDKDLDLDIYYLYFSSASC